MLTYKEAKEFETFWREHEEQTSMRDATTVMLAGIGIVMLELLRQQGGVDKPTKEDKEAEAPPPEPEPEPEEEKTHKVAAHRIEKKK